MTEENNKFWLNTVLDEVESKYPEGEIIVSSGISPSASYHIGHFREILSADIIKVGLELRGRKAKHLHIVDNFDPLRKRYDFLPEEYEKYVGWPVCLVPDPEDCHDSYAEHFFQEFYRWVEYMKLDVEVIRSYQDLYKTGKLSDQIETSLENTDKIVEIFAKLSNRKLEDDWAPVQILSDDNSFNELHFKALNKSDKTLTVTNSEGQEADLKYDSGRVKLNWRLDWPARWQALGVQVEPHGFQEHGASGGSFETGQAFSREIFDFEPPIAGFQYGHVHLPGDQFKMSSSKNNLVTPEQAFGFMPPEVLRYFYTRYPGKKKIFFDPGLGYLKMMDEYSKVDQDIKNNVDNEFAPAYQIANSNSKEHSTSSVPFSHLVSTYQAALGNKDQALKLLEKSGYKESVDEQADAIKLELDYVANWLENWAPDDVKFELQKELPEVDLTEEQKTFLSTLADGLKDAPDSDEGQWYHGLIHDTCQATDLKPSDAFQAVYKVLLNQERGPRAGAFLAILDNDFLIKRFRLES